MSKIEDFENASAGATAINDLGHRALKTVDQTLPWTNSQDNYLRNTDMADEGYTLDQSASTTAREAVELAWELAYEVKEGQVIPEGAWLVERRDNKITVEKNTFFDITVDEWGAENIRTVEPLPDPKPDWLNAPAVLALVNGWMSGANPQVFTRYDYEAAPSEWLYNGSEKPFRWQDLRDVVPLYPKEGQDA